MLGKTMTPLKLQKRTLVLESDLNRLTLQAELRHLHSARTWTSFIKHHGRGIAPWALAVAPLAGVVVALGARRTARLVGSATRVIRTTRNMFRTGRALTARAGT